jgi:alcohol dehydrogenase class IV
MFVPGLRAWGIGPGHVPEIARRAAQASSMKANPIALTNQELEEILAAAV